MPNSNLIDIAPSAKKRLAMGPSPCEVGDKSLTITEKGSLVIQRVEHDEIVNGCNDDPLATPQKNANKKKLKAQNGEAIDSLETGVNGSDVDGIEPAVDPDHVMEYDSTLQTLVGGANSSSLGSAGFQEESVRAQ